MLELPRGVWGWMANIERYLARIAVALEQIAEEITRIRKAMEVEGRKEDGRQ